MLVGPWPWAPHRKTITISINNYTTLRAYKRGITCLLRYSNSSLIEAIAWHCYCNYSLFIEYIERKPFWFRLTPFHEYLLIILSWDWFLVPRSCARINSKRWYKCHTSLTLIPKKMLFLNEVIFSQASSVWFISKIWRQPLLFWTWIHLCIWLFINI